MPRKLRRLSGADVVRILGVFKFVPIDQKGSHQKLRRIGSGGAKQTLVVPLHADLDRGTLRAIFRQAVVFIPEDQLEAHFYTK